jgi:alanyl-tRNA synthetase
LPATIVTYPSGSCHEEATVLDVMPDPRASAERVLVISDVTPFHPLDPLWPDQPADHGELQAGGQWHGVPDVITIAQRDDGPVMVDDAIDARRDELGVCFRVAHVLPSAALPRVRPQSRVTVIVDAVRRRRLSAAHTACHLLAYALNQETHQLWTKPARQDSRNHHDLDAAACVHTRHDIGGSLDKYRLGKSLRKRVFDSAAFMAELPLIIEGVNQRLAAWKASDATVWAESRTKRHRQALSGSSRTRNSALLICGFGVQVPGGAPEGLHVSVEALFTFGSWMIFASGSDIPGVRAVLAVPCVACLAGCCVSLVPVPGQASTAASLRRDTGVSGQHVPPVEGQRGRAVAKAQGDEFTVICEYGAAEALAVKLPGPVEVLGPPM